MDNLLFLEFKICHILKLLVIVQLTFFYFGLDVDKKEDFALLSMLILFA